MSQSFSCVTKRVTKIGVGRPFPPHYTTDLGNGRTLTPNIAQVPSHAKASFSSRNLLHVEIEMKNLNLQVTLL